MMADHWKLIANRLGAPGVDEPEAEEQASQPVTKPQSAVKPEQSAAPRPASPTRTRGSVAPPEHRSEQPSAAAAGERTDPTWSSPTANRPASEPLSELGFDPSQPIPDEALSFGPPRKRAGRKEEPQSESKAPTPFPAARSFSEPPTDVAPEARREAPRMTDRVEPAAAPVAAPPPAKAAKRKSSWESLANMFNIKVDRSKPAEEEVEQSPAAEPAAEGTPDRSRSGGGQQRSPGRGAPRSDDDQQLSIFSGEQSNKPNAALKSMFGDSTAAPAESWGKPRMVDDLGWEDDSDSDTAASDEGKSFGKSAEVEVEPGDVGDVGEEPVRRGRRRRRGRRGRAEAADAPVAADDKVSRWGGLDEADEVTSQEDEWPEPDSFESLDSSHSDLAVDSELDSGFDLVDADEEVAGEEPERRSNRRRRRGRGGRGRDREAATSTEPAPGNRFPQRSRNTPVGSLDEDAEEVGFLPDADQEDDFDTEVVAREPRREGSGEEERSAGRGRRRRRGRSSSEEGRGERAPGRGRAPTTAQRIAPGEAEEDEDFDSELAPATGFEAEEDEGSADGKHRNIPTWADSIETLVAANMENRKRGDNRGAPRGRPRGRR